MKQFMAGVVIGIVLAGGVAHAQQGGSGESYLNWAAELRLFYGMAWTQGFTITLFGVAPSDAQPLRVCIAGRNWTTSQMAAVIESYVRANPSQWHEGIAGLALKAVLKWCGP